jgi:hypothetical protein
MNKELLKYLLSLVLGILCASAYSQELNCTVEINSDQVTGTNTSVFSTLQEAITEYMNSTKFSNAQIATNEKIECRLFLTVVEYNDDVIKGNLQIQSTRPVYNTNYTTTLFNFKDDNIEFTYREGEPLIFSENSIENNLTAILDYYAYLILAIDFDTFSLNGGQQFFDRAQSIVQMSQNAGEIGWKSFDDRRNRAAVLNSFTEPGTSVIRNLLYEYHRKGLDEMSTSPAKGRAVITRALDYLQKIYQSQPMSVALNIWHDAKLDELINIYSQGSQEERDGVYELLYSLYPTEQRKLKDIKDPPKR